MTCELVLFVTYTSKIRFFINIIKFHKTAFSDFDLEHFLKGKMKTKSDQKK